jgi:hypothetical protein
LLSCLAKIRSMLFTFFYCLCYICVPYIYSCGSYPKNIHTTYLKFKFLFKNVQMYRIEDAQNFRHIYISHNINMERTGVAQSAQCLTTNWTTRIRSPAEATNFPLAPVSRPDEAHPASFPMGTGGSFTGCKARSGRDADHSPHLVRRSRMSRSCTSSPLYRLYGVHSASLRVLLFLLFMLLQLWGFLTSSIYYLKKASRSMFISSISPAVTLFHHFAHSLLWNNNVARTSGCATMRSNVWYRCVVRHYFERRSTRLERQTWPQ